MNSSRINKTSKKSKQRNLEHEGESARTGQQYQENLAENRKSEWKISSVSVKNNRNALEQKDDSKTMNRETSLPDIHMCGLNVKILSPCFRKAGELD